MIPYRLTDFYDPEPDEERADREYDARREREVEREVVRDFTDEEWEGIRGSDFDDGDGLRRPHYGNEEAMKADTTIGEWREIAFRERERLASARQFLHSIATAQSQGTCAQTDWMIAQAREGLRRSECVAADDLTSAR